MKVKNISKVKLNPRLLYKSRNSAYNQTFSGQSKSQPDSPRQGDDTFSMSDEAKKLLAEEGKQKYLDPNAAYYKEVLEQLDRDIDAKKPYTHNLKCLKIAMDLIKGNSVSSEDEAFLADREPSMCAKAFSLIENVEK